MNNDDKTRIDPARSDFAFEAWSLIERHYLPNCAAAGDPDHQTKSMVLAFEAAMESYRIEALGLDPLPGFLRRTSLDHEAITSARDLGPLLKATGAQLRLIEDLPEDDDEHPATRS